MKIGDLPADTDIEATCTRCGLMHYRRAGDLASYAGLYLDEAERRIRCRTRTCGGAVRIALIHQNRMEGFVGGMA
jgi:hypothetical protein